MGVTKMFFDQWQAQHEEADYDAAACEAYWQGLQEERAQAEAAPPSDAEMEQRFREAQGAEWREPL